MKEFFDEIEAGIKEAVANKDKGGRLNYLVRPLVRGTVAAFGTRITLYKDSGKLTPSEVADLERIKDEAFKTIG